MNKVSRVTMWVEPDQKQIVKYTFENVSLDFLPASWLVRVTELRANMLMSEAFPAYGFRGGSMCWARSCSRPDRSRSAMTSHIRLPRGGNLGKYLGPANRPR